MNDKRPQPTADTTPAVEAKKPFMIAVCKRSCVIHLQHHGQFFFFGGDIVADQAQLHCLRRAPEFEFIELEDRAAYAHWLFGRDAKLLELRDAAAALGHELWPTGYVTKTTRGHALHPGAVRPTVRR